MSFGSGTSDIIVTSGLAIRVYIAYKDAPDGCQHISDEAAALQILIDRLARHFTSSTIPSGELYDGQKALRGCQGVLQDLHDLMKKYKRLALMNKRLVFRGVKLGKEDITTLQLRLISNAGFLTGFVQKFVVLAIPLHQSYEY